jgi:hypothetical protein
MERCAAMGDTEARETVIEACRRGERDAFRLLFEEHKDRVYSVALYFFGGDRAALDSVLEAARPRDTLTLWHLLARVEGDERARVYERLAALAPPPDGVTREGVLRLDRDMLDAWKAQLETRWLDESFPTVHRVWRKLFE